MNNSFLQALMQMLGRSQTAAPGGPGHGIAPNPNQGGFLQSLAQLSAARNQGGGQLMALPQMPGSPLPPLPQQSGGGLAALLKLFL